MGNEGERKVMMVVNFRNELVREEGESKWMVPMR